MVTALRKGGLAFWMSGKCLGSHRRYFIFDGWTNSYFRIMV